MSSRQYATFYLNDILWGLNILQIREVMHSITSAPVPHAPNYVQGLMNLRGQIITIIDLATKIGKPSNDVEKQHCIILKTDSELESLKGHDLQPTGNDAVGLLVDKVGDVIMVPDDEVLPTPVNLVQVSKNYVRGVVRLQGKLMLIIDLNPVVNENL